MLIPADARASMASLINFGKKKNNSRALYASIHVYTSPAGLET